MSLGIENVTSTWTGTQSTSDGKSSDTITVSTSGTNRVCVLMIYSENNSGSPPTVSTPPTSAHVTWTRAIAAQPVQSGYYGGGDKVNMEVWVGEAATQLSGEVISVSWSGTTDGAGIIFMAISGASSVAPFLDPNVANPQSGNATSLTLSTTNNDNVLFQWAIVGQSGANYAGSLAAGFTQQINFDDHHPSVWDIAVLVGTDIVTTPVTSDAIALSGTTYTPAYMVFAITGDAAAPSGTWASTEAADTFAATAQLGPRGTWASVEATDIMDFVSKISGTWASTDTPDVWTTPPFGAWHSTEPIDIFAATGLGPAPSTWDPRTASSGVDLENMNLTATNTLAYNNAVGVRSTSLKTTGTWYTEFNTNPLTANNSGVGIINASGTDAGWGNTSTPGLNGAGIFVAGNGEIWINGVQGSNWAGTAITAANIGVAIDLVHNLIWFRTNGGLWNGIAYADPTKPPGGLAGGLDSNNGGYDISAIVSGGVYLWAELVGAYDQATMNAGATAFAYAAPSGYTAWNDVPVAASPLQIDGYATSGLSEVSGDSYAALTSGTITLSTTQHNDVIVLGIAMGGYYNTSTVATVTDTAGLTWHRRNQRWLGGGTKNFATNGSTSVAAGLDIEIWWAHAPNPLVADVITITPAANVPRDGGAAVAAVGSMSLIAWGVSGANYAAPWDTHSQAGGYVDYGGGYYTPAAAQLYTKATNCFLFGFHGDTQADAGSAWSPWTYVANATGTEHDGNTSFASLIYQQVDEPQEAVNVQTGYVYSGSPYGSASSMMFDSIVAMGETGTTQEIVWFWDSNNTPGGSSSGVNGILQLSPSAPNLSLNYSSSNFNLMVLLQVMIQSASGVGEVTSIGESQGLVSSAGFERRSRVVTATPNGTIATEIWWAWMPMYTAQANNDQITIYTSGTAPGDIVSAQMWGLGGTTGAFGLGDPFWDTNTSLPAVNSNTSAEPIPNVTDISTNSRSTMLVAWTGNITQPELGFTDPFVSLVQDYPLTIAPTMNFASGAPPANLGFEFMYSEGLAVSETAEFNLGPSPGEPVGWLMIGDAIPVGPPQPPSGAWASVEHKDTFTHTGDYSDIGIVGPGGWVGFLPIPGVWASTEHTDEFTGAPAQAPYDSIGWLGWVPAYATMAATETKDHMVLDGWLLGFGGITGQMGAREADDRFGATNYATVTGTWASVEAKDRMADNGYLIPLPGPPVSLRKRRLLIVT